MCVIDGRKQQLKSIVPSKCNKYVFQQHINFNIHNFSSILKFISILLQLFCYICSSFLFLHVFYLFSIIFNNFDCYLWLLVELTNKRNQSVCVLALVRLFVVLMYEVKCTQYPIYLYVCVYIDNDKKNEKGHFQYFHLIYVIYVVTAYRMCVIFH